MVFQVNNFTTGWIIIDMDIMDAHKDRDLYTGGIQKFILMQLFYGKRKDKLGTLVFIDSITYEVLIWKHIETEKANDYKQLLSQLLELGYTINSVTVDGKKGLYKVFKDYPIQMCQFHPCACTLCEKKEL